MEAERAEKKRKEEEEQKMWAELMVVEESG